MYPAADAPACVFCRKHPVDRAWRPFCSERCKLLDLARWADGAYRVPGAAEDSESEPGERPPTDPPFIPDF
jgi:endogenous inhibitor of DNA gyrase (YacG/DUF329 family)